MAMLSYPATWYLSRGHVTTRRPRSEHPSVVPFGAFPTADGWLMLACVKDKFFARLVDVLGVPGLADDPRFATVAARRDHHDDLLPLLDAQLEREPTAHWLPLLEAAGVPSGPVNSLAAALDDPFNQERGLIVETPHDAFGIARHVRTAARGWWPTPEPRRAPRLGEQRDEILGELLGCDVAEIAALATAGAFGRNGA
jgi:crotonobetainyl-CoA:carnitine CoA-transferase CaiB-like acyl-CoA transferase